MGRSPQLPQAKKGPAERPHHSLHLPQEQKKRGSYKPLLSCDQLQNLTKWPEVVSGEVWVRHQEKVLYPWSVWALEEAPREWSQSSLGEFKLHLDGAFSHMVGLVGTQPGVRLDGPGGFLPTQEIL